MALHNQWDGEAAQSLWGPRAARYEPMLAWFRDQVGTCTKFSVMRRHDDLRARFAYECERGAMEVELEISDNTQRVKHTWFGARGVEPPADVRQMAEHVVALAEGAPGTEPMLTSRLPAKEFQAQLAALSRQGSCNIDRVHLGMLRGARFVLECTHGPMNLLVQLDDDGALERLGVNEGAADEWRMQG